MSDDTIKDVTLRMKKGLADLPSTVSELFAHGADTTLQDLDKHQVNPLQVLRNEKLWYLQSVLQRREEESIDRYVQSIAKFRGKDFFIGDRNDRGIIESSWSVESVLLMSFFTVELFRKYEKNGLRDQDDPIFNVAENLHLLRHFLISSKAQFPFSLLVEFFNLTRTQDEAPDALVGLALHFFENMVGHTLKPPTRGQIPIDDIKHLLDLVHRCLCPPFVDRVIPLSTKTEIEHEFINYASELEECGIRFERIKGGDVSLLDITFKNGKMKIPSLKFAKSTMELLKTLIQYEKKFPPPRRRYVSDYVKFMLCLVNSPEDVEALRRSKIIENWMGNYIMIFNTLEDLGSKGVNISHCFTYSTVMKEVNKYCSHRPNLWMAKLRRNYFNSPWSIISLIAAVVLLLLTFIQTFYSILSYHYKK